MTPLQTHTTLAALLTADDCSPPNESVIALTSPTSWCSGSQFCQQSKRIGFVAGLLIYVSGYQKHLSITMVTCETVDDAHTQILQVSQCSNLIKAIMII